MNILFFTRLFYPHIGGVEKHVMEVSKILLKRGHKITIVTEQDLDKTRLKEVIEKIEIFRIPKLENGRLKKFKIWKWLWKNVKLIENADVIHCHDVFFWYLPFRIIFPFKKVFTTFHGYEDYPLKFKYVLAHKIFEMFSMGNICVGDFIRKWYKTKPNYVSYGAVNSIKNKKINNRHSALFIGRLDRQTGILTYVEAINILKKKISDFRFLVIGDGDLKDKLSKEIKVLKPINNASEYFNDYNFAFVSRYLSMMEAMVARRLVFAVYDNPIKEDYLRMSPFSKYIIICNSSSELLSKINYYLDNQKDQENKIREAYAWAKKQSWDKVVEIYLKLWKI
jgi:glycosyltransferase involved in cell wall biosynthesis